MGNTVELPRESNMGDRLRCSKCDRVLPPCTSFDNLYWTWINGIHVYVFNRGEYYREVLPECIYQCVHCFHQPFRDQERRQEEERRRIEEERKRQEEQRRRQEEERRKEEEERRRQGERRREEERRRQEEKWRREEEARRRKEEERRRQEERRKEEEEKRRQEERRREEERRKQKEERRREEKRRKEEEERRRQEEERWREEEARRRIEQERRRIEEERRREEEVRRRIEEERRRQEEERRREEEVRRRIEEERRRQEERRKEEEERRRQEERRREEERRRKEEERKREEERQRREAEEERRGEELNQRLKDSLCEAEEQREEQFSSTVSEELQSKREVLKTTLDEFEMNDDQNSSDELLEILSSRCNIPVQSLSLCELTAEDLGSVLSVLDTLLFDEWISALPSLSTLQHTQVFLTELCSLSVELSEEVSLQNISIHVQQLVDSISQSASNVFESFLLSQALYLTLMHFFTEYGDSQVDAVLIAKQWAEDELSTDQVFIVEFLSSLISSLNDAVERASVFILKIEIKSLKLLLSTLTNLSVKETHSECVKMILGLVKTNQWSPMEALTLLRALSQKYAEEDSICKVLTLVQEYDMSPEWTDESGQSLIQALDSTDAERFTKDLQNMLRRTDGSSLSAALAELKMLWDLNDSVLDLIKNITTNVLNSLENTSEVAPLPTDSIQGVTLDAEDVQVSLFKLCKAVFDTKGWWPTVRTMLRWCALVLSEKSAAFEPLGLETDPCVTAMFAAKQVLMGNKMDIVLSSDECPEKRAEEWSDFYKHLGMSVNTIMKKTEASNMNIYEVDVVYGTADAFFSDYIQHGLELMEAENPQQSRGFVFEGQSLSFSKNLDLSGLKGSDSLVFAAKILQSIVDKFHSDDEEERHRFMKALFLELHTNHNKEAASDIKILYVFEKITGKQLSPPEVFILTFLESLLKEVTEERESETQIKSSAGKWCLENLFDCLQDFKLSTTVKDLLQMVSGLTEQRLWSPVEGLSLLKALTDHHHDQDCINIMKILHLITTYQVSSQWTDDNNQSLLNLLDSWETKDLIQHLEKSLQGEKIKSTESLFEEIRQIKDIDEQTLDKSYAVVTHVRNLINTGEIEKHTDVQKAKSLSHSKETQDLQEVLAVLCNVVYLTNVPPYKEGKGWWPRDTQMISWCLLALSDTGRLLEMGTGEGKSCVIAMFAALHVMRGEKVDVVSSSSVLCQRDTEEWRNFYEFLGMTVDRNTNKTEDEDRKKCYQRDVVYGTIEAFAADHLRQIFEMKDVRPERRYQCIIIDEVDSLLLDQGVQLTYLSSPMVSMEHLNTVLALIWGYVSQCQFLSAAHQTFVRSSPASFFKTIFDSIETEGSEIKDPTDILRIAEETNTVNKGFTEEILNSDKDGLLEKLKTVSQDAMLNFFQEIEDFVPYGFTVYTLDDEGLLCLRKHSPYNNQEIPELKFLVLDEGLCCTLYDSEEALIKPIAELISQTVQFTPCSDSKDKTSIPGFLKSLVEKKVSVWVQNAFLAMQLTEGQEYVVQNDSVCPVDFRSTGIIELNKKWGDGLQQFVEIKHKIKLSTISIVTNYVSNISFFEMYGGNIYGTTGTLGTRSDIQFLQTLYPTLSASKMPTFNRRKLFEVKGTLTTSAEEWKSEIKRVVMEQISSNSHREGRAALVICETINKAEEICEELKKRSVPGETILYCRSDNNSLSKIEKELLPGDVIVATNLAGRGTDIKVSKSVNKNGGLFVVLSFLSENTRVELQAFGRTARKGKPGSAQIIMSTENLQPSLRTASSLEEAKSTRDRLSAENTEQMMKDVAELRLREELFSEYCQTLQEIHADTDGDEKRAVVAIMNEFWGVWLQIKSEEIDQLKRNELKESLKADLSEAKSLCQSQTSPCSSIYHYIKFGNIALGEKKWDVSSRLFEKAIQQDESWAAIAFYSRAYCTIMQRNEDYLTKAIDDLRKAQDSLKYLTEESTVFLAVVKISSSTKSDESSIEKQFLTKKQMFMCLDKNITEAIKMLQKIKKENGNAIAKKSPISSLVTSSEEAFQVEADNLFRRGLHYVFAVEKEPRFPWEALLVFLLGAVQIIGGALLTAFTFGTLAQVGMGLITEGISDCIYAIESMVTGEFSWKSWAIEKAISIGISLIGFGVGKLISKGFKACKAALKAVGKQLKSMPKFLTRQAKDGLSVVAKTNMKNAVKHTAKKMVEEVIMYGLQKGEEEILKQILQSIEEKVKEGIDDDVKSKIETEELGSLVDSIIFSQLNDKDQLQDLLEDKERKSKLLSIFTELSNTAIQPFTADLSLQKKLNSSIYKVIERAKAEVKGKAKGILTAIQAVHMGALAAEAITATLSLSSKFFTNFEKELSSFKVTKDSQGKKKKMSLSPSDTELLKGFKQELADTISRVLAAALVEVFHQKFSSHMVSIAQSKAHQVISGLVRTGLRSDRTDALLKAGQNNNYIAHMPTSKQRPTGEAGERSTSYAEKIKDSMTPGTLLDARVMSETTSTKVVILTEDSRGRLTKMQELSPSTKPAQQTVTLIYRPNSEQHPGGHYDVFINNKIVKIDSKDKNCLFHAMARGMKPDASEAEITEKAGSLRHMEADALLRHPDQWDSFIKRKELTQTIRGGDWFMAEGAKPPKVKIKETKKLLKKEVGKVEKYKNLTQRYKQKPGLGQILNADHQPPVSSILEARNLNQNSKLAKAMLEVGTNSSPLDTNLIPKVKKDRGPELPAVYVPYKVHRQFPSTRSPAFRQLLASTIASDDVVGTFKFTIIGSKVCSDLKNKAKYKSFQNSPQSKTRLSVFQESFQQHSTQMVQTWFNRMNGKGVMTNNDLDTIKAWINNKGYDNQNDPHRNQVSNLL